MNNVLLVTTKRSIHASKLEEELSFLGTPYFRLNTDEVGLKNLPQLYLDRDNIRIWTKDCKLNLSQFEVIWWDEVVPNPKIYENIPYGKWAFLETQKASDWILSSLDAVYVNDPIEIIRSSNKVKQLKKARDVGLYIPQTTIVSEYKSLEEFLEQETVYKPISRPTKENVNGDFVIYTNVVNKDEIDPNSLDCKLSLFQRYISKKYEIRAYVINNECLAAEIHSQASERSKIDWRRYDIANTPYYQHTLPDEISEKLIRLTKSFNLYYSAIDLIKTPRDEYVFLELNPQGMWLWVEKLTGLQITRKLATLLSSHKTF